MDFNRLRSNLNLDTDSDDTLTANSVRTLTRSPTSNLKSRSASKSRSRSRSPVRTGTNSALVSDENSKYRQRNRVDNDRLETNSSRLHIVNTSANTPIKLPQFQKEQNDRGRSRDRQDRPLDKPNEESSPEDPMISLMGFSGFGTTKGKQVKGTSGGATKKQSKSEYRQYMNRTKGFNRPLSPGR